MKKLTIAVAAMAMTSVAMSATVKVGMDELDDSIYYIAFDKAFFSAIAERTGDTYEFVKVSSSERLPKLLAGEVDIIPAMIKREHKKNKNLIFSVPYTSFEMSTVIRKSEAKNTKQLKNKLVCVDSDAEKKLAESYGAKPLMIEYWKEKHALFEQGKCAAVIASRENNDAFMKAKAENKKLYIHKHKWFNFFNKLTLASTKDKKDIITRMNAAIRVLKQNGTLKEMQKKYFSDSAK